MKIIHVLIFLCALPALLLASCRAVDTTVVPPAVSEIAGSPPTAAPTPASLPPEATTKQAAASYGKIPPYFIENRGQQNMPDTVRYYTKGSRGTVYLATTEAVFDFLQEKPAEESAEEEDREKRQRGPEREEKKVYDRLVFRLKFKGANPEVAVSGEKELPGKINYFIGSQSNWRSNIPTFEEVVYRNLYDGIDLKFNFAGANLESTFTVQPGADPEKIILSYEGIDELKLKPEGDLVAITTFGGFVEKAPRIYQVLGGKEVKVEGKYLLTGDDGYSFEIGDYDSSLPLIIK
jgi:hypothetical protein